MNNQEEKYYPRVWNTTKVPNTLIYPPEDKYNPSCKSPWIMQDTLQYPNCFITEHTFSPRSQGNILYNKEPNSYPPIKIQKINNAMYDQDLSRYQNIGGIDKKITAHFKLYPRTDFRPYEFREQADCFLPVPTMKRWTNYPVLETANSKNCKMGSMCFNSAM